MSGKALLKIFERKSWELVRVRGSHHIMRHPDGRAAVIPIHGNATVHIGIVQNLLRKHLRLSDEEIAEL